MNHQACRGNEYDDSVTPASDPESKPALEVEDGRGVHTLPASADFIMCYSVAEGEVVPMDGKPSLHSMKWTSKHIYTPLVKLEECRGLFTAA